MLLKKGYLDQAGARPASSLAHKHSARPRQAGALPTGLQRKRQAGFASWVGMNTSSPPRNLASRLIARPCLFPMLQVQQLMPTIDSTLTLLRNGGDFAVSAGGSTESYFRNALDPVAAALTSRCAPINFQPEPSTFMPPGYIRSMLDPLAAAPNHRCSVLSSPQVFNQPAGHDVLAPVAAALADSRAPTAFGVTSSSSVQVTCAAGAAGSSESLFRNALHLVAAVPPPKSQRHYA